MVAVSGVTGGCGSTTLAMNLAAELARLSGKLSIVAEPGFTVGQLATYLDLKPNHTLADLLEFERLDVQLVRSCLMKAGDQVYALCGPHSRLPLGEGKRWDESELLDRMVTVVALLRRIAPMVVLDVRSTFDTAYFEIVGEADKVVLVAEQTFPSLRTLQLIRDSLTERGINVSEVVINKYDSQMRSFTLEALRTSLNLDKPVGLPLDGLIRDAINHGRFLRNHAPRSLALFEIEQLAQRLAGITPPPDKPGGGLRKLLGYFTGQSRPTAVASHA